MQLNQSTNPTILDGVRDDMGQCLAPVRDDLLAAHALVLTRIAQPGVCWTGAERLAIASATRTARHCVLCAQRKSALSPQGVAGSHDVDANDVGTLPAAVVDIVHFATTDAARMSRGAIERFMAQGFSEAHYVEALGIAVALRSIDQACRGLGVPLHQLPQPVAGAPSGALPEVEPAGDCDALEPVGFADVRRPERQHRD